MSERYFYLRKAGRITGPFEAARLLAGARHGRIGAEDEISRDKREWRRVAEVPWLKPESAAEPPLFAEPEIRMPEPEAPAEAAIPPVAAPVAVSPVFPIEPEEEWEPPEVDLAEAPSARRLVGDALSLIWNTTDNLLKIPERYGVSGTVWSGVTAWLGSMAMIMAAIAAFGRSYRFWEGGATVVAGGLFTLLLGAGLWAETAACRIVAGRDGNEGAWHFDWLTSGAVLLNFSAAAVITLATAAWTAEWKCLICFNLFVWSFSFANGAAALRIGLTRFADVRPRHAIWLSAVVIGTLAVAAWAAWRRWLG